MELSSELVSQFAKAVMPEKTAKKETTMYGTVVYDGTTYVRLDGAPDGVLTPVTTTCDVKDEDRVTVVIKDHSAVITGNLTHPSAASSDVQEVSNRVTATDDMLEAEQGRIDNLVTEKALIREELTASKATIGKLEADNVIINEKLVASEAEIKRVEAEVVKTDVLDATYAKITELEAVSAEFHTLESTYGAFQQLTTNKFTAVDAQIANLDTEKLSADQADIKYADIDFANVDVAKINQAWFDKFYANSGIIENVEISEGVVVKELVGVKINADDIYTGTLTADRLVVKGSDGLYYELNVNALGQDAVNKLPEEKQEELKNGLHGSNIIAKSIAAEKIAVDDLVAFGADIAGFKIESDEDSDIKSLHSVSKTTVDSPLEGIYMDSKGQVAFGDSHNFVKFFKDTDGTYKLIVSADQMKFSTGKSVEDTIDYAITEKGRNWLLDTKATRSLYRVGENAFPSLEYEFSKDLLKSDSREFTISYDAMMVNDEETADIKLQFFFLIDGAIYGADSSTLTTTQTRYVSHKTLPDNYTCADITAAKFRLTKGSGTAVFTNVKLESGSEASDWTPAPEDTDENITRLEETLRQEIVEQSAEIVETSRGITMTALEEYVTSDEYEEYKTARQAEFEVLSEGITGRVTAVEDRTESLNKDLQNKLNTITKYFTFDINGLQIGAIESEPRPVIRNENGEYVEDVGGTEDDEPSTSNRNWIINSSAERALSRTSGYPNTDYEFSQDLLNSGDREFTVSYNAYMAADATGLKLQFFFNVNNGTTSTVVAATSSALTTSQDRYVSHVTLPDSYTCADITATKFRLTAGTGTCYFKNVKLESGDTATEWSPAPEDEPAPDPSPDEPGIFNPTGGVPVEDAFTADGRQVYQYTDSDGTVKYYCLSDVGPSPNKVVIDNDEISILVNEIPVQTFKSDGSALIPSLSVTQKMQLLGLQITSDDMHINCDFMGGVVIGS